MAAYALLDIYKKIILKKDMDTTVLEGINM